MQILAVLGVKESPEGGEGKVRGGLRRNPDQRMKPMGGGYPGHFQDHAAPRRWDTAEDQGLPGPSKLYSEGGVRPVLESSEYQRQVRSPNLCYNAVPEVTRRPVREGVGAFADGAT